MSRAIFTLSPVDICPTYNSPSEVQTRLQQKIIRMTEMSNSVEVPELNLTAIPFLGRLTKTRDPNWVLLQIGVFGVFVENQKGSIWKTELGNSGQIIFFNQWSPVYLENEFTPRASFRTNPSSRRFSCRCCFCEFVFKFYAAVIHSDRYQPDSWV